MKNKLIIGFIVIPFIFIIVCFVFLSYIFRVEYGIGVDSIDWLPPEAQNISYYYDHSTFRKAEFEIEQGAFERWCISINKPLHKIVDNERASIFRCLWELERKGIIPKEPEPEVPKTEEEYLTYKKNSSRIKYFIPGDLYYEEIWDNGGGYQIGYDISEGKGYYSDSSH